MATLHTTIPNCLIVSESSWLRELVFNGLSIRAWIRYGSITLAEYPLINPDQPNFHRIPVEDVETVVAVILDQAAWLKQPAPEGEVPAT